MTYGINSRSSTDSDGVIGVMAENTIDQLGIGVSDEPHALSALTRRVTFLAWWR
jgi:hypothetical protein